jgi:glycosyltransferase involved in cell wall biosynthesis
MLNLARGFHDHGFKVDLVVMRLEGELVNALPSGPRLISLGNCRTLLSISRIAAYLRAENPTAIISALPHVNIACIAATRLANTTTQVMVTEHNCIELDRSGVEYPLIRWAYRIAPAVYRFADNVIGVSKGIASELRAQRFIRKDSVECIYNPVYGEPLESALNQPIDHPWLRANSMRTIVSVGRLVKQKNFGKLIEALELINRREEWRLIILGEGPERSNIENLASRLGVRHLVNMPGFVENAPAYIRRASVFALSSAWEALPTVLIEALACCVPIVATNCKWGPAEILEDGRHGSLVPVNDPTALAEAIREAIVKPRSLSAQLARAQQFNMDSAVRRYASLIRQ